jgi:transcriptional regulator with XRE-family HTH domain
MSSTLANSSVDVLSEDRTTRRRMAKADLRKAERADWLTIGHAVERTRTLSGLSLKEFADLIRRDPRQVARWIAGEEPPQVAPIFAQRQLRQPFLIALAERVGVGVEIRTVISVREGESHLDEPVARRA